VEGRRKGEWVLLDYVDFVVHIFLQDRRAYYNIERLRKSARVIDVDELKTRLKGKTTTSRAATKTKPAAKKKTPTRTSAKKAVRKVAPKRAKKE
jgi:ribosome-associated protein